MLVRNGIAQRCARLLSACALVGCCWISGTLLDVGLGKNRAFAQTIPEGTLPPVIVTPEPTLPPVVVEPGDGYGDGSDVAPLLDPVYPSLMGQRFGDSFGGLDGLTRNNKSIFDTPGLGTIVDRQTIDERQATDMFHTLQQDVGILMQATARGQSSPFLRGLTGQQVLLLKDGIRLNNSIFRAGPNQYFNLVDPGQVERVEVIRGAQSAMWGSDAVGGAINIVTRSADQELMGNGWSRSFNQILGSADTSYYGRVNIEGWVGQTGIFAGGGYMNVGDVDIGGGRGRQPFTNYSQYSGDIKLNYLINDDSQIIVSLSHFEQESVPRSDRFPPFVFGPPAATPRPTYFDPQQYDIAYIRWQGYASGGLFDTYSFTASYQRNKEGQTEIRNPANDIRFADTDVNTFGATMVFAKELGWAGTLTYGSDFYYDDIDAFRYRWNATAGTETPQNPIYPNDGIYNRFGAFLSWDVDVTDRFTTTTSVRYENVNAEGTTGAVAPPTQFFKRNYNDVIGSFGAVYKLSTEVNIVGGVYQTFRAPNMDDLASDNTVLQNGTDLPSLNVQPEDGLSYEIGIKVNTDLLRLQAMQFWMDLDNNILRQAVNGAGIPIPNVIGPYGTPIPGSDNFIRQNFDCYVYGTEFSGDYTLSNNWLLYGNCWFIWGEDQQRNEPLTRIPPLQGIVGLRWRDNSRTAFVDTWAWMVDNQDRYAAQNNNDARFPVRNTPGYATLNLRIGKVFESEYSTQRVTLTLENLTDKYYRVLGSGVDGTGFNAMLGYEYVR